MANNDRQIVPLLQKNPIFCPGFERNSDVRKGSRLAAFCIRCYSHRTLHTRVAEIEPPAAQQLFLPPPPLPLPQPQLPLMNPNIRPRTRFTEAQKNIIRTFAANSGWKIRRQDSHAIVELCSQIGVGATSVKSWIWNHRVRDPQTGGFKEKQERSLETEAAMALMTLRGQHRTRTRCTKEQEEKLREFAERRGWRTERRDRRAIDALCKEIGVEPAVVRNWVRNHRVKDPSTNGYVAKRRKN